MTLQGHPSSFILAPIESAQAAYDFLLDLNSISNLIVPILPRFKDIIELLYAKNSFFDYRYPFPIPAKISGCSPWSRPVVFGSAESEHPKLTNREIIL